LSKLLIIGLLAIPWYYSVSESRPAIAAGAPLGDGPSTKYQLAAPPAFDPSKPYQVEPPKQEAVGYNLSLNFIMRVKVPIKSGPAATEF
jgi:hypothetical protein